MSVEESLERALVRLQADLGALEIRWALVGGMAFTARDAQLARFEHHPSPGVREVVRELRELNRSSLEGERKRDRDRELHGLVASE